MTYLVAVLLLIGAGWTVGQDTADDRPVHEQPSSLSQLRNPIYTGRSGVNPYDDYSSIPTDELFIADSGGHLDQYLYRDDVPGGALTFNLPITRYFGETNASGTLLNLSTLIEHGVIEAKAILKLRVWDVDDDYQGSDINPEVDKVMVNGVLLTPDLSSGNQRWNTVSYEVGVEHLKFPQMGSSGSPPTPAQNQIQILIDQENLGQGVWAVEVDWAKLRLRGIRPLVLIHGYSLSGISGGNPNTWDDFREFLEDDHVPHFVPGLADGNDPIDGQGCIANNGNAINGVVNEVLDIFGVTKVNLVAHSKGGHDSRYFIRHHDASGTRTESLIQLGTPNHGFRLANPLGSCAWRNLNPDWIKKSFNYSVHTIVNPWPTLNQKRFIPRYNPERLALKIGPSLAGRFRHAYSQDDNFVNPRSAVLPWAVACTDKNHEGSPTHHCPDFIVSSIDAWDDSITWPNAGAAIISGAANRNFPGLGHGELHDDHNVYNYVLQEIRSITGTGTAPKRSADFVPFATNALLAPAAGQLLFRGEQMLSPGATVKHTLLVDNADRLYIQVMFPEETDLMASLVDGEGNSYPVDSLEEAGLGQFQVFDVAFPAMGTWSLEVTGDDAPWYVASVWEDGSPIIFRGSSEHSVYQLGETVLVQAEPSESGSPLPGNQVRMDLYDPNGNLTQLDLYDDGSHGDIDAGDGIYANNQFVPGQVGNHVFSLYAEGVGFQRQKDRSFTVVQNTSSFNGSYGEAAVDSDGDGLYNQLFIDLGLNFTTPGNYEVSGNLVDDSGNLLASAAVLVDGTEPTVSLPFDGEFISAVGSDGPYHLTDLLLRWTSADQSINADLDFEETAYDTAAYAVSAFQRTLLRLAGNHTDMGEDTDGDSLYNWLHITLDVDVVFTGNYQVDARLVTMSGREIAWANRDQFMSAGNNQVTMTFDGRKVRQSVEDGPYLLKDLVISGGGTSLDVLNAHQTASYDYTQFQTLGTDFTLTAADIAFSEPYPRINTNMDITATVHNLGSATTDPVLVRFFDGNPDAGGVQIGSDMFIPSIGSETSESVTITWSIPAVDGSHQIYVEVNGQRAIGEFDFNNNKAFRSVYILCYDVQLLWNQASQWPFGNTVLDMVPTTECL